MSESNTALSRLRAGLDRDEAIARAAIESLRTSSMEPGIRYEGDVGTWVAEPDETGAGVRSVDGEIREIGEPESWRGPRRVIFSGDGQPPTAAAQHIAEQGPSRVLRQVAAIRELLDSFSHPGCRECPEAVIEALASIYPEDTTETEKP
ncbi:DUF6221 family protein [Nocardia sp. NPDC003963]